MILGTPVKLTTKCPWCLPVPANSGAGSGAACTCWKDGAPCPCDSPRCPAGVADEAPIGAYRVVP